MNLEEAINHAKEVSSTLCDSSCGLEHLKLATWLEELQTLKTALKAILEWPADSAVYTAEQIKTYVELLLKSVCKD